MQLIPGFVRRYLKIRRMQQFYRQWIQPGDLCFDIGANHGDRTQVFRNLGARVLVLEPQTTCFRILQDRFRNDSAVTLMHAAAGAVAGQAALRLCSETDACATLSEQFVQVYGEKSGLNWHRSESVTMVRLTDLIEQYGIPKFCKVDTEGYESEVFQGLDVPLPFIMFEFNQGLLGDTVKALQRLGSMGAYQCNFICYEHMELMLDTWVPLEPFERNLKSYLKPDLLTGEVVVRLEG